jgi:hypothetical protein
MRLRGVVLVEGTSDRRVVERLYDVGEERHFLRFPILGARQMSRERPGAYFERAFG